jgi:hypothetical protein
MERKPDMLFPAAVCAKEGLTEAAVTFIYTICPTNDA